MRTVKVPVALLVIFVLLVILLVVYLYGKNSKLTEEIVSNEKVKQENERLVLLQSLQASQQLQQMDLRETIGFKLT